MLTCSSLQFYDLPYTEMLDAIHDAVTGKKHTSGSAQHVLAVAGAAKRPPPPPGSAPRTTRARVGKRQMAPAPTPAVVALNDVGFNVTSVQNFQVEVAMPGQHISSVSCPCVWVLFCTNSATCRGFANRSAEVSLITWLLAHSLSKKDA